MRNAPTARNFAETPLADDVLHRVLDNARFAPSGSNRQGWRVIVVRDPDMRRRLRDIYVEIYLPYARAIRASLGPKPDPARLRVLDRGETFANNLDRAPVLMVITVDLQGLIVTDCDLPRQSIVGGASIYPFTQNIILAARAEGLAAALTTILVEGEERLRTLLGIPPPYAVAAVIAMGWPAEPLHKKLSRKPVEQFARLEVFDGPALTPGQPAPVA